MATRLVEMMSSYFGDEPASSTVISTLFDPSTLCPSVPIVAYSPTWEIVSDPNRLAKTYVFEDQGSLKLFVEDLLGYQSDVDHFAKMIIENLNVVVEVYTHDINDITELDQEFAVATDEIYNDIQQVGKEKNYDDGFYE